MELFPKCQHYFSDDSNSLRVASTYSATADIKAYFLRKDAYAKRTHEL